MPEIAARLNVAATAAPEASAAAEASAATSGRPRGTVEATWRSERPIRERAGPRSRESGLTFAFIPKGTGVLLVPVVPKQEALKALARGASATDYRDRTDRF